MTYIRRTLSQSHGAVFFEYRNLYIILRHVHRIFAEKNFNEYGQGRKEKIRPDC